MVPMMIVHAAGRAGAGTSLDNTMRFGEPADDEWVLLHVLPKQAVAGFRHGSVHVRSRDRRLPGTGSQTSCRNPFDCTSPSPDSGILHAIGSPPSAHVATPTSPSLIST